MTQTNEALVEALEADMMHVHLMVSDGHYRAAAERLIAAILPIIEAREQAVREACAKVADKIADISGAAGDDGMLAGAGVVAYQIRENFAAYAAKDKAA